MPNALAALATENTAARIPTVGEPRARQELGQETFLTLMVTQLKNQDPFKPLEADQFLGQLAQFSTVSGIDAVRKSVESLSGSLQGSQVLQGATLVGRSVLAAGQVAELTATGDVAGSLGAPAGSSSVQVRVVDADGSLVRAFALTPGADFTDFVWDGRNDRGERVPPGRYGFEGVAQIGGKRESVEMLLRQRVDSVTLEPSGGALRLNTPGGVIALGDVRRIM